MKASSFTKSPYTFVPLQARIWRACTTIYSTVMYILSGENITAVFTISRRRWDQNTTQLGNRLDWARATYVWLLHISSMRLDLILLDIYFMEIFKLN
jgi:hypothetical protein